MTVFLILPYAIVTAFLLDDAFNTPASGLGIPVPHYFANTKKGYTLACEAAGITPVYDGDDDDHHH